MRHFALFIALFCSTVVAQTEESWQRLGDQTIPYFIQNQGQLTDMQGERVSQVLFYMTSPAFDVFITNKGLTYLFKEISDTNSISTVRAFKNSDSLRYTWERVDMDVPGARILKENALGEIKNSTDLRYFSPQTPDGVKLRQFQKIVFSSVFPGIDWVLYTDGKSGLKHEFIARHMSDPHQIRMVYKGKREVRIGSFGDLEIETSIGVLTEEAPISYFIPDTKEIHSAFKIESVSARGRGVETEVSFDFKELPGIDECLVLDPALTWCSFFGGTFHDWITSIRTDSSGNIFTCGYTQKVAFPLVDAGTYFQGTTNSQPCAFINKFDKDRKLVWSTFYAGSVRDAALHIEVDPRGDLFVVGHTLSPDLPLSNNGGWFQAQYGGNSDLFILRFDNAGNRLGCSYFGGAGVDWPFSTGLDSKNNLLIAGQTQNGGLQLINAGGYYQAVSSSTTGFVLRFNNTGSFTWGTYFGKDIESIGLAIDKEDNIYVCGEVLSSGNVPVLQGKLGSFFKGSACGPSEGFISKLDANTALVYSSYLGGCERDLCHSMVCDKKGNLFVCGTTKSNDFPLQDNGSFFYKGNRSASLPADAFVLKFDSIFKLKWSTCLGGSNEEILYSFEKRLALSSCDELWFEFETRSILKTQQSCEGGYLDSTFHSDNLPSSNYDMFLTRFSNEGHLQYATYFGGNGWNIGTNIHYSANDKLFLTGIWRPINAASLYPTEDPGGGAYIDSTWNGQEDSYVAEFSGTNTILPQYFSYASPVCEGSSDTPIQSGAGFAPGGTFSSQPGLGVDANTGVLSLTASSPGTYTIQYTGGICACSPTISSSATVEILPPFNVTVSDTSLCEGSSIVISSRDPQNDVAYTWLPDGINSPTLLVSPGTNVVYSVQAKRGNCVDSASIAVKVEQRENTITTFNYPDPVCNDNGSVAPLLTEGFRKGGTFSAENGIVVDSLTGAVQLAVAQPGSFSITYFVEEGNCYEEGSSQAIVNVEDSLDLHLVPRLKIEEGESAALTVSSGDIYEWVPGDYLSCADCSEPIASPPVTTRYCVTAGKGACLNTACTVVEVICRNTGDLSIPNAFTPNNDLNNDAFCLQGWKKCALEFSVMIFDRWGAKVFESGDPDFCWDGTYQGRMLNEGVYMYHIYARYDQGGEVTKSGNITLIR